MQEYGQNASASGRGWGRGRRYPTQRDNDAQDTHGRTTDRMRVSSNLKSTSSATVSPRQYALNLPPTAATTPLLARWRRTRSASRVRGEERRSGCAPAHDERYKSGTPPPGLCARRHAATSGAASRLYTRRAQPARSRRRRGQSRARAPPGGGRLRCGPSPPPPPPGASAGTPSPVRPPRTRHDRTTHPRGDHATSARRARDAMTYGRARTGAHDPWSPQPFRGRDRLTVRAPSRQRLHTTAVAHGGGVHTAVVPDRGGAGTLGSATGVALRGRRQTEPQPRGGGRLLRPAARPTGGRSAKPW